MWQTVPLSTVRTPNALEANKTGAPTLGQLGGQVRRPARGPYTHHCIYCMELLALNLLRPTACLYFLLLSKVTVFVLHRTLYKKRKKIAEIFDLEIGCHSFLIFLYAPHSLFYIIIFPPEPKEKYSRNGCSETY